MARVTFAIDTPLPPERVRAAILDFGDRRPWLWPGIDPKLYRVYVIDDQSAEVQEGSANPFVKGGVWVREHYDWSHPGLVRATTVDSNVFQPGSVWEMRYAPTDQGGTHIDVLYDRKAKNAQGRLVGVLVSLAGKLVLASYFKKTLKLLETGATVSSIA